LRGQALNANPAVHHALPERTQFLPSYWSRQTEHLFSVMGILALVSNCMVCFMDYCLSSRAIRITASRRWGVTHIATPELSPHGGIQLMRLHGGRREDEAGQESLLASLSGGMRFGKVMNRATRTKVMIFGPQISAVGGGPTHLRNLFASPLSDRYELLHFEIGSRGRESPASEESIIDMSARLAWSPFRLIWQIVRLRPAIVHLNSSLNHKAFWRDLTYLTIAKLFRRKVIYQVHGGSLQRFCGNNNLLWWLADRVFGMADAVVVLSSVEEANFRKLRRVQRLAVIRNAVDLREFDRETAHSESKRATRLVYLGRLTREKGLFEALDAMRIVASDPSMTNIEFLIAGSGPARGELAHHIAAANLDASVKLVEPVFGAKKVRFLEEADVFLFPSYHEGLPYSVLESLAAGTPVIATRVGGIPDAVIEGVHGLLIEPRNVLQIVEAIKALVSRSDLVATMSRNCHKWAREEFGLERLAQQFDDLYHDIVVGNDCHRNVV